MKNAKQRKNKILIILAICLVFLAGSAYYIFDGMNATYKNSPDQSNNKQVTSNDANQTTDKYLGWKSYCSTEGGLCLRYPKNWTIDSTSNPATTITNQSKTVQVVYIPSVTSSGGYCGANTCFFSAISISNLNSTGTTGLKLIKGVFTNEAAGTVLAQYFVGSDDRMSAYSLRTNEKVDVGFFAPYISSPLNQNAIEQLRVKPLPDTGFNSEQEATTWLSGTDVKTAGNILESLYLN